MAAFQPSTDPGLQHSYAPGRDSGYVDEQAAARNNYTHHADFGADMEANRGPVRVIPHQSTVSQVYKPEFFKIANPGPLGLIAFALTTLALGFYQCGVGLPNSDALGTIGPDQAVFGLAVFFGGLAQLIAGIMEFRVGNTFGCTLHCSYGAFWLAFAMFLIPSLGIKAAYGGDMRAFSVHLGIFLILWCLLTVIFFLAALRTNLAILGVLGCLAMAFLLLAIAQFIMTTHLTAAIRVNRAGGAFAIICALLALYSGASGLMVEDTTWLRFPLGEIPYGVKEKAKSKGPHDKERVN